MPFVEHSAPREREDHRLLGEQDIVLAMTQKKQEAASGTGEVRGVRVGADAVHHADVDAAARHDDESSAVRPVLGP